MQEEMFGHARAGEVFFENLRTLLARQDSHEAADCLEVYTLCMLLGFKGQYALSSGSTDYLSGQAGGSRGAAWPSGEIQTLVRQAREKINRIRGQAAFLPDGAPLPEVKQTAAIDRWSRGLGIAAICLLVLTLLVYGGSLIALISGASSIG